MKGRNYTNILLAVGFLICLLQIWLPEYYLTGDGPCHVNNAKILHDLWSNQNTDFYNRFFTVQYQPNPNWLSSVVIALLLFLVSGAIAEKIFLSIYVLLYLFGFLLLLKKISGQTSYWLLIIFAFVFNHVLSKGFYNYAFSVAFYFWVVWSWIRLLEKRNIPNALLFVFFNFLAFFTHLLAFTFSTFTCAMLAISFALADANGDWKNKFVRPLLINGVLLGLLISPFLILMRWFTENQGGLQLRLGIYPHRLKELIKFSYLTNIDSGETIWVTVTGICFIAFFLIASLIYIQSKSTNKFSGLLPSLIFAAFVCLFFPEDFLGRLILISMRVQLFVFISLACCIAYMLPAGKIKNAAGIMVFICFLALSIVRIPVRQSASRAALDITSCAKFIQPNSVVLPLNFSFNGIDERGNQIADKNWLFVHPAQYIGAEKPLIILDNYEANMGYFPLVWKENVNPYFHLSQFEGIEGQPPYANLKDYKASSGVTVDYILMWCYDSTALKNEHFRQLYAEINTDYHQIYTSATQRTVLYQKNQ